MKTNHLRNKPALVVGLSIFILFGVIAYAATIDILAVGTIARSEFFDGPATVTVRTLTLAPGDVLSWHYHLGYAFNVVKSGALTVEDGCGEEEAITAAFDQASLGSRQRRLPIEIVGCRVRNSRDLLEVGSCASLRGCEPSRCGDSLDALGRRKNTGTGVRLGGQQQPRDG